MGCECWNSVTVFGASDEIDRFRRLCIELPADSDPQAVRGSWDGYEVAIGLASIIATEHARGSQPPHTLYASNYREKAPQRGRWSFFFDTTYRFPEDIFEQLASHFPALHFDCECIDSLDDYMGYGWFNVPQGGEPFRQDFAVPKNYWTSGDGYKRTPTQRATHKVVVERLVEAALGCAHNTI